MNKRTTYLILQVCFWVFLFMGCPTFSFYAQADASTAGKSHPDGIICWWRFNNKTDHYAMDEIQWQKDMIYGNFQFVPGVDGHAIKLDGFRTYIKSDKNSLNNLSGPFTVEAWIALASYPWSWAPIIDCSSGRRNGFFFGIDQEGHAGFKIGAGSSWYEAVSERKIPLRKWTHVAAIFESNRRIGLFINGKKAVVVDIKGDYIPLRSGSLTIGRTRASRTWEEFQLTTPHMFFFLDGLLDEIKIVNRAKTEEDISRECAMVKDPPVPALSHRDRLPTGPAGPGNFGAFYTRLNYYEEWEDLWRVSDVPDLFVRFEQSPVQLVFWRGAGFVPSWVTENGIWYTNEWLETWGNDVVSCAEPIMDRQCRYSHVRLIENTDARAVVHWRYALSDAAYDFVAVGDDGRGEWCDEFHIIYPDQVGVRKMDLHYSKPERKHDWAEQIIILPPGKYPDDVIEKEGVSLVNMSGDVHTYSWHDKNLQVEMPKPEGANMSFVHLKSTYRPFLIVSPDPVETVEGQWASPFFRTYAAKMGRGYRPDPVPSVYGWWSHWPVAQVPGDGRWVTVPDRPSHFNLTTFIQWRDYKKTEKTRTRIMLQGMTDRKASELVPLAKSWLQAPKMTIATDGYSGGTYDQSERAYLVEKKDTSNLSPLMFGLQASKESPLFNPAVIIKNWGSQLSTLWVNGEKMIQGEDVKQGIRKGPLGEDLIIWIRLERQTPVKMMIERRGK